MRKDIDILLTGGHAATTAISVINEIKARNLPWNLYWVGAKSAFEGKKVPTLAEKVMPDLGVKYIGITTGRLQKKFTIWTIPSLLKIPIGFWSALKVIRKIKPKRVVSFGGFVSVPVCFWAWVYGIPVIIHEQTVAVGRANKICARFATKILIARKESEQFLPGFKDKIIVIGNPVSDGFVKIKPKTKISKKPVIYITGGSSGAQKINSAVNETLYELLKSYKLIHQTGKIDYEKFKKIADNFPSDLKENYEVYDFIDPTEIPNIFSKADLIISRAGANTVSEIMIARRPAILIPIPWAAFDEQTKNANLVEKSGLGAILPESNLTGNNLLVKIEIVVSNWEKMVNNFNSEIVELDKNASKRFVDEI